jgi:hypothetical protein
LLGGWPRGASLAVTLHYNLHKITTIYNLEALMQVLHVYVPNVIVIRLQGGFYHFSDWWVGGGAASNVARWKVQCRVVTKDTRTVNPLMNNHPPANLLNATELLGAGCVLGRGGGTQNFSASITLGRFR